MKKFLLTLTVLILGSPVYAEEPNFNILRASATPKKDIVFPEFVGNQTKVIKPRPSMPTFGVGWQWDEERELWYTNSFAPTASPMYQCGPNGCYRIR